jgi:hypothetical protein
MELLKCSGNVMLTCILSTLSGKNPPQWLPEGCTERPRRADKAEMSETAK